MAQDIDEILNPRSIAVVGASENPEKWGYGIMENLTSDGFEGAIYPVNSRQRRIFGLDVFKSLEDIPGPVDMVNISVPSRFVADIVRQAVSKEVRCVVINTNGFREIGRHDLEEELTEIIHDSPTRIIGPNVQGIMQPHNKLSLNYGVRLLDEGPVGIIAQSGSISAYIAEKMSDVGIGISALFNLGNQIDLCESDFIEHLANDLRTRVIAVYLEGPKDKESFKNALMRAARKKPIVMFKPGVTTHGAKAAASHTGSIAGRDQVFSFACRQYGVNRCSDLQEYVDTIQIFARCMVAKTKRVVVISTSGGVGSIAVDELYKNNLEVAHIPAAAVQKISSRTGARIPENGLLDLAIDVDKWRFAIDTLCNEFPDCFDAFLFVVADGVGHLEVAASHAKEVTDKPIVVVYMSYADQYRRQALTTLKRNQLTYLGSPERAAKCLKKLGWYHGKRQ